MDDGFLEAVRPLMKPWTGTESRAWLLYSLVRMTRPRRLLEVGMGYTTPFLLEAMADNVAAAEDERRSLDPEDSDGPAGRIPNPAFYRERHEPRLVGCDADPAVAEEVARVAADRGLAGPLDVHVTDFRLLPELLGPEPEPFDFAFFDCGGPPDYVDFLREFWPLIAQRYGHLVLDFTYWCRTVPLADGTERAMLLPGSILNEIKRQELRAAPGSGGPTFETLSLLEPHKRSHGSLTLIRRLPPESRTREVPLRRDLELFRIAPTDREFKLD